ncbi:twin-arginine translocase TatA/TatE family subunit [Umezawaea sp. Da 62-37]|uniref:twin-arginine translocase TatA/TatE family subunit n=1 Tax=Umezawaea sp. Da 62-37 TaxID=3075927 RepID=UPI0028F7074D|nr:twin-arginine translocase TatA/TatE family subunit [Umezawaea sp. Da 62-37]WNV87939.1 twin-arginine translocase TatA/TatE family subunit [Umezawaea sp. Da 62-37]
MFGLGLDQVLVLLVVGFFVLGPERLPHAAASLARAVRRLQRYCADAEARLGTEFGPGLEELRRPLREAADVHATVVSGLPSPARPGSTVLVGRASHDPEAT